MSKWKNNFAVNIIVCLFLLMLCAVGYADKSYDILKADFLELPLEKRLSMPLFWIHNETDVRLKDFVDRIEDGGNGSFVIESRPHYDWLGTGWYDDCKVILDYAKTKGMGAWIFDEEWWPSFVVGGKIPKEHRVRKLLVSAMDRTGGATHTDSGHSGSKYIKTVAGKISGSEIDADNLIDLTPYISNGNLSWNVPSGTWKIMKFTWEHLSKDEETNNHLDVLTQNAVNWFVDNAIKPHYDNTGATNIKGFFYDEPQFSRAANWGVGMENDTPYWKEMLVGWFYTLTGEAEAKAKYLYYETMIERYGRIGLGTYRSYVNSKGGKLTGHWIEEDAWHNGKAGGALNHGQGGALNLMELEKNQDMPAMDLIGYYDMMPSPGTKKNWSTYHLPKLISSVSITNDKEDHLAMCEIFGGAGQDLSYADMKWWGDWCQVKGVNVMDPHSFNTKGSLLNIDKDNPPFFYYDGDEANWPNYKAWCERQNRTGYMLSGNDANNYSVAPVAMLWTGYSKYAEEPVDGDYKNEYPYSMQSALDRVHYDHNLLTYSRFDETANLNASTKQIELYNSRYKILVMPPVEIIPYDVLNKVKQFYDMGGTVIAWQRVPSKSAKFDKTDSDIQSLSTALWKSTAPSTSTAPLNTNSNGGKAYFIAATDENTITGNLQCVLSNSGIDSDFEVVSGEFEHWGLYNHRVRMGMDVFMLWNGAAKESKLVAKFKASGMPEMWNPSTKAITVPSYKTVSSNEVEVSLTIPANESILILFKKDHRATNR
jgi:hypothetical protein